MPKNIEDIIPSGRRSIKSIPIPVRKTLPKNPVKEIPPPDEPIPTPRPRPEPKNKERWKNRNIWIGGVLGVMIVAFAVFSLISSATLAYTPKTEELTFNKDTYVAYQAAGEGQLAYSVVKLSLDKSIDTPASGEETVSEKASGTVVVYNQQAVPQKLVKTTRFETPEGLIFRTPTDLTIPAKGSVEAVVVADQMGTSYNIGLSDFTLPGFKGTPNFEKVYARSKTPMSGGFVGTRKKVSDADLAKAKASLDESLRNDLLSQAKAQVPPEYVLFPDLSSITYSALTQGTSTGTSATVNEHADMIAIIFKKSDLEEYLAAQKLGSNKVEGGVELPDISKLDVNLFGTPPSDLSKVTAIRIQVDGTATARYVTDEAALKADLAGQNKKAVTDILKSYPSIEKASSIIRPFWKSDFPSDTTKIKIERR